MPKQRISGGPAPARPARPALPARSAGNRSDGNGSKAPSSTEAEPGRGAGAAVPAAVPAALPVPEMTASAVMIRGLIDGPPILVPLGDRLDEAAQDWRRIVRNRIRWTVQPDARSAQAHHSRILLRALGVDLDVLDDMAVRGVIQVSVPFLNEDHGWAARIFPWEYVLSSATRDGCARPLVVLRHLVRLGEARERTKPQRTGSPDPVLILESAPGSIRQQFHFDSERKLVWANLPELRDTMRVVLDPSPAQVEAAVQDERPGLIHLAGLDTHQGAQVLGIKNPNVDGMMLADDRGRPSICRAEVLAELLATADRPVRLVACNFQDSAARVAALIVSAGAEAAIGFQDVVNDTMAELFFARFYANWADPRAKWGTVVAFARTLDDLRSRPGVLSGLGIVLWSETDAIADGSAAEAAGLGRTVNVSTAGADEAEGAVSDQSGKGMDAIVGMGGPQDAPTAVAAAGESAAVASALAEVDHPDSAAGSAAGSAAHSASEAKPGDRVRRPRLIAGKPTTVLPSPELWVEATPNEVVNYVHLHNNGSLFETFRLRKGIDATIDGVQVEVVLYVGRHSFPYRATWSLTEPITEINDKIRIPLTADLLRSAHESVQSVVYFRVRHNHVTLREDTRPVTLASVDEWMDTDEQTRWLPSFVLPRDPAVDEIRRRALPALRARNDARGGGFLGYQAIDKRKDQPYRGVDDQAIAIWSSLAFDYDLSYVNPPPTYVEHAQRLRTPSEILRTQSGTCIDLALLYAACLEAADIYPFIVMYEGHANVGFWRSPEFHEAFQTLQPSTAKRAGEEAVKTEAPASVPAPKEKSPSNLLAAPAASLAPWAHPGAGALPDSQADPWEIQRHQKENDPNLNEVRTRLERQDLVILDATRLTFREGFQDAAARGRDSFDVHEFRSLVDIRIARKSLVTPLPMRNE